MTSNETLGLLANKILNFGAFFRFWPPEIKLLDYKRGQFVIIENTLLNKLLSVFFLNYNLNYFVQQLLANIYVQISSKNQIVITFYLY